MNVFGCCSNEIISPTYPQSNRQSRLLSAAVQLALVFHHCSALCASLHHMSHLSPPWWVVFSVALFISLSSALMSWITRLVSYRVAVATGRYQSCYAFPPLGMVISYVHFYPSRVDCPHDSCLLPIVLISRMAHVICFDLLYGSRLMP